MEYATPHRFHSAHPNNAALPASVWSHLSLPSPALRATVIIPAKDEADALPSTLAALAAQTNEKGQPLPPGSFEVLVLANNCTDNTAAVVRTFAANHPTLALHVAELTLPPAEAHVGRARRLLMDEAAHRLELAGQPRAAIISTDADTRVAPDWLAATFRELELGVDAVAGRILMEESSRACPVRRCQLQDATCQLLRVQLETQLDPQPHDPWPRHHQHFGASLAVTVAAYRQVGGLPVVPFLEDEALYQALLRHDLRVRHSPAVRVFTSGRQQGRVAVGLSWQLREWARLGQQQLVPNPATLVQELNLRRQLRQQWRLAQSRETPERVVSGPEEVPAEVLAALPSYATFGAYWDWARPQLLLSSSPEDQVPLVLAISILRTELARASTLAYG
ncbi:glycosyltransferase [Hymenobacter lapidiphilus]|uniref:Glycosyltransferase family 2 protein n=1 Tax=Hymenobacter lapidiphilus TaxID=2608003 RepID=A0A7Y7U5X3_9BACT|nr:glycosyltransferase family 2 protein [Hymenobacter lapidiphilus]NVO31903.1 glycosyltransferase family 2 protein [Hymenobacter lapidiphilus]